MTLTLRTGRTLAPSRVLRGAQGYGDDSHRGTDVKRGARDGTPVFRNGASYMTAARSVYIHEPVRETDKRYKSTRWKKIRLIILAKYAYRCQIVPNCPAYANVCDHIDPVYPGMPDSVFFDPRNLRAACRQHNVARGFAATLSGHAG